MAAPAVCPSCASDDIFFSAVAMRWKCNSCKQEFDSADPKKRKESVAKPASAPKKVIEVGEQHSSGYIVLARAKTKEGSTYALWKSPAGKSFRIEEDYPKKGKLIYSSKDEEDAMNKFKELTL